jgi:hypothetical protein
LIHREDETASLIFLRQVLKSERDQLTPVGGVVCEMIYPPNVAKHPDWEFWTFDYSTFERFVDIVEVTRLDLRRILWSIPHRDRRTGSTSRLTPHTVVNSTIHAFGSANSGFPLHRRSRAGEV